MLRSLDISKSAGEDMISGKFLRDAAEVISSPLKLKFGQYSSIHTNYIIPHCTTLQYNQ